MRPVYNGSHYDRLMALLEREGDSLREVLVTRAEMNGIIQTPQDKLVALFPSYSSTVDKIKRINIKRRSYAETMDTSSQAYYDKLDELDREEMQLKEAPARMIAVYNGREIPVIVSIKA